MCCRLLMISEYRALGSIQNHLPRAFVPHTKQSPFLLCIHHICASKPSLEAQYAIKSSLPSGKARIGALYNFYSFLTVEKLLTVITHSNFPFSLGDSLVISFAILEMPILNGFDLGKDPTVNALNTLNHSDLGIVHFRISKIQLGTFGAYQLRLLLSKSKIKARVLFVSC
ncbi:hypothetical protein Tco_1386675 [Tanacetum coccineum]